LQRLFDAVLEQPGKTGAQLVAERGARQPGVGVRALHGQQSARNGHKPHHPHCPEVRYSDDDEGSARSAPLQFSISWMAYDETQNRKRKKIMIRVNGLGFCGIYYISIARSAVLIN